MRRLAVLAMFVIVTVSLFGTAASGKPRRHWCARAAVLQQQIADIAAQRDALAAQLQALGEHVRVAGRAPTGQQRFVFPLYRFTPEDDYAYAQERCTNGR